MPLIVKTPLRISLFGGGSDYHEYFLRRGGVVLGGTIDQFIYLVCLPMSSVAETRYRFTYSRVEAVNSIEDIQHPVIREVLKDENYHTPFNLAVISDIPGGSGLGSSSAFTVGFLNLIRHLKGQTPSKIDLAQAAVRVEREILQERVGVQDQYHAAFGGLSLYEFNASGVAISPIHLTSELRHAINSSLVLIHTRTFRSASAVLEEQMQRTTSGEVDRDLDAIKSICYQARNVILKGETRQVLADIGKMLSENWRIKRSLSSKTTNAYLDDIYESAMKLGAYGGKLAGAGGGGFFVFLSPPDVIEEMKLVFGAEAVIKVQFQEEGSRILKLH